jgi:BASS family bile acid:Na+ symporter
MTFQELIMAAVKLSIVLTVLAIGLKSSLDALMHLFRRPGKLARSLLAIDVVMPLFAIAVVMLAPGLPAPVKVALIALSVAPAPPLLAKKAAKASSADDYSIGLLAAVAVIAIVFVPVAIGLIGPLFGVETRVPIAKIAGLMLSTILVPVAVGILVRSLWPAFAARVAAPIDKVSSAILISAVALVVVVAVPQAVQLAHSGAVIALASFVIVGLVVGHVLGGPDPNERTVLALATSSRHPGVALTIAAAASPDLYLPLAAVALYILLNIALAMPYALLRKRMMATKTERKV